MPSLAPAVLIARHVEKLRSRPDAEKIDEVLSRTGLRVVGDHAVDGARPLTAEDCYAYKHAVRDVYGDTAYSFARVNFVLGGCTCSDCKR